MNGETPVETKEVYLIFYKQGGISGLAQQLSAPFNVNPVAQPKGTAIVGTASGVLSYVRPDTTIQKVLKVSRTGKVTPMKIEFKNGSLKVTEEEVVEYDDTRDRMEYISREQSKSKDV